jgi:hypothetical protein
VAQQKTSGGGYFPRLSENVRGGDSAFVGSQPELLCEGLHATILESTIAGGRMIAAIVLSFFSMFSPQKTTAQPAVAPPTMLTVDSGFDPYAALRLLDGKWDLLPASGAKASESVHLENQCAKAGEFFACNQFVNGKNMALLIFLPSHALENGGYAYRNQVLRAEGENSGAWGSLEITGVRWTYSSEETDQGKKIYWRTTNVFSGSDKIHFEVQRSEDGTNWTTNMSGDEARTK